MTEGRKKFVDQLQFLQPFTKHPDCFGIRHPALRAQSKKKAEAVTITDLKLRLVVREVVKVLKHQYVEHQTASKGGRPPLRGLLSL